MTEFEGLTVVITGAASGIGLTTALRFSDLGARVYGLDLNKDETYPQIRWIACDIGDGNSVQNAINTLKTEIDSLDILVNNAGVGAVGTVEDLDELEWQRVLNINVIGIYRVSKAALPLLRKSPNPCIVNTCSIASSVGLPNRALYSASKGAVMSLTMAMAADGVADSVRVNCVNPGTVETPWVTRLLSQSSNPDSDRIKLETRQPIGRLISADEVASAILYLSNPRHNSTTGTVLYVDGGMNNIRLA